MDTILEPIAVKFDAVPFLTGDYAVLIARHLDPIDIINFSRIPFIQTRKVQLCQVFRESIARKIDRHFRDHFGIGTYGMGGSIERYDEFKTAMIASFAVISGSFILQIIFDEYGALDNTGKLGNTGKLNNAGKSALVCKPYRSDIDVFVPIKGRALKSTEFYAVKTEIEDFLYSFHSYASTAQGRYQTQLGGVASIEHMRNYGIDKFEHAVEYITPINERPEPKPDTTPEGFITRHFSLFQVISLYIEAPVTGTDNSNDNNNKINPVRDFIHAMFDFDVLKNTFYYDKDGCHVTLQNPQAVIDKKINFDILEFKRTHPHADECVTKARIDKYQKRGFTFV